MLEELEQLIGELDFAHVALLVTTVLGSASSIFQGLYRKLSHHAVVLIPEAETKFCDKEKAGGIKLHFVVNELYRFIPYPLRWLFPRKIIIGLVQRIFLNVNKFSSSAIVAQEEAPEAEATAEAAEAMPAAPAAMQGDNTDQIPTVATSAPAAPAAMQGDNTDQIPTVATSAPAAPAPTHGINTSQAPARATPMRASPGKRFECHIVREKNGKLICTQYSVRQWQRPLDNE